MQEQIDTTNWLLHSSVERCTKLEQIVSSVVESAPSTHPLFQSQQQPLPTYDVKAEWKNIRNTPLITGASPSVTSSTTTLASAASSSSSLNLLMQLKDDMNALENVASFEHVPGWLREAEANVGGPYPGQCVFLLVGHKADRDGERQVQYEEGEYLAKHHNMRFLETSAMTGENVLETFTMVAHEINSRLESGALKTMEGWEGIKTGSQRAQSICLSEADLTGNGASSCAC